MNFQATSLGFIGAGQMAEALIKGVQTSKETHFQKIICYDLNPKRHDYLQKKYAVTPASSLQELVAQVDICILAVKPQNMTELLAQLTSLSPEVDLTTILFVSIAAGITLAFLQKYCPELRRVVRVMPNTPCFVSAGMSALSANKSLPKGDLLIVKTIFEVVGKTIIVEEHQLDIITALSGSGPAFFYQLVQNFVAAGVVGGLDASIALPLVTQTMLGAAKMIQHNPHQTIEQLIQAVASKGGTTEAGLKILQNSTLATIQQDTITAAFERSQELAQKKKEDSKK